MVALKTWLMKDGDIVFQNGGFVWIYDDVAVRQRLENRLKYWLNEVEKYTLKTIAQQGQVVAGEEVGIDYFDIFNSIDAVDDIEDIIQNELLKDEFVETVEEIEATLNKDTRKINVNFKATGSLGTITGSV